MYYALKALDRHINKQFNGHFLVLSQLGSRRQSNCSNCWEHNKKHLYMSGDIINCFTHHSRSIPVLKQQSFENMSFAVSW